jgi:ATP-dependent DNA helicase RecG
MGLNDRQVKAVQYVKDNTSITNSIYQKINATGKTTATEDIQFLVDKKILRQAGSKGRGSKYELYT